MKKFNHPNILKFHEAFLARKPQQSLNIIIEFAEEGDLFSKIELEGKDTAVVSTGPLTLKLKEEITKAKKNVSLYNAIYLRPMDEAKIEQLLGYKKIIIYDPYSTKEGFVYRETGISQIYDIIECGYVRANEKRKSNQVWWTSGGENSFHVNKKPILVASSNIVTDYKIGAISVDDLSEIDYSIFD